MSDTSEWDELARRAQQGDKAAYHRLLTAIAPYIKNILSSGLANPDWADDITQDVLMSVHKSLARYFVGQSFRPWLNAIIRYRRADFFSRYYGRQDNVNISLDDANERGESCEDPIARWQDVQGLEAALGRLSVKQQKVFRLLRVEGYSVKEVAQAMAMSESAVKVSAHRSAQKLKDFLKQQND